MKWTRGLPKNTKNAHKYDVYFAPMGGTFHRLKKEFRKPLKLKASELFELENIANADTFSVYDCDNQTGIEILDFQEACRITLQEKRKLVYAYNKVNEETKGASRCILLTRENLELYNEWKMP